MREPILLILALVFTLGVQGQSPVAISATNIDQSLANTIQGHLNNGTSVIVNSTSSITVNTGVTILKSAGSDATLTLKANFRVTMNINTSIKSTSSKLNMVFWSNATNNTTTKGMIRFGDHTQVGANVVVETNGGHLWMGGGATDVTWNGVTVGDGYAWGSSIPAGNGWYGIELYGDCRFLTSGGDISLNGKSTDQTTGQGSTFGIYIIKSIFNAGLGSITVNTLTDGTSPSNGTSTGIAIVGDGGFTTTTGNIAITNTVNAQGNTNGSATGIYLERNSSGNISGDPVISSNQGNISIATSFTSPATQKLYVDLNELNFLREKASTASSFTEPLREIFENSTSTYSSSATNVATVNNSGLVSLIGVGTTDISGVLSRNDWNAIDSRWRYRINVVNKADPDLTFAQAEVFKQSTDTNFTLTAVQQNQGGGTLGAITYNSSNRSVATVNAVTSEVTIVGEGSTDIAATSASTVTYAQGNASYTLYVTNGLAVFTTNAINNNGVVTVFGNVVSDGGNAVTERGFVYATTTNPTISDNKVVVSSGTGTFSGNTPSLASGTYYFRAFATNSTGTVYGSEFSIAVVAPIVAPSITSFLPTIAGKGETVVITGTGFTGVSDVFFGNQSATSYVVDSDTQITAVVGNGASGTVTVANSAGTDQKTGFIFKVVEYLFEGNTIDNTAANLDATLVNTATYGPGARGQAICFDNTYTTGANVANYLTLPSDLIRGQGTEFTISLRFKTDARGALLGYNNTPVGSSLTNWIPLLYVGPDGRITATIWLGTTSLTATSTSTVMDNNWHKVDMSIGPGAIAIYVDDVLEGTSNGTIAHLDMNFNQLGAAGVQGYFGRTGNWEGFKGCIDDFMILDRALTTVEIQQATTLPAPTITSFTPSTAQEGATITITGTNFIGATSVVIGGVVVQSFTVVSETEITAIVPANATQNADIQVITAGGTATASGFSNVFIWAGNTDTDGKVGDNWNVGNVPPAGADIRIPANPSGGLRFPVFDADLELGNVEIETGATMAMAPGRGIKISTGKDIIIHGSGKLILQSNAEGTAFIETLAGGSEITGTVVQERHVIGSNRSFRFMSHPFKDPIPLSALGDKIDITGSGTGFTPTATNNPSAFYYDPATGDADDKEDGGWKAFTAMSDNWNRYQGIRVLVRGSKGQAGSLLDIEYTPDPVTFEWEGEVNTGDQIIPLAYHTPSGGVSDFNLIGNPFPAAINLKSIERTASVGSHFYIWQPREAVVPGATLSGRGGSYLTEPFSTIAPAAPSFTLPTGGAFFIRAGAASQSLTIKESDKVNANEPLQSAAGSTLRMDSDMASKYGNNSLQLVLESHQEGQEEAIWWDRVLLFFDDSASANGKDYMDASKLSNPEVNFFTVSADNYAMATDIRPYEGKAEGQEEDVRIPLHLLSTARSYNLRIPDYGMEEDKPIYLYDHYTKAKLALSKGFSYSFEVTSDPKSSGYRFDIVVGLDVITSLETVNNQFQAFLLPNPAQEQVRISIQKPDNLADTNIRLVSLTGVVVRNEKLADDTTQLDINLSQLSKGIYLVEITHARERIVKRLIVN